MKRFFGRKKKKKVKDDADIYRPPSVDGPTSNTAVANANASADQRHQPSAHADGYHTVQTTRSSSYGNRSHSFSSAPPPPASNPHPTQGSHVRGTTAVGESASSDAAESTITDATSGYRYALSAYAETISPAYSNEDGMGGGGGTLRSRSGRVRGSAGLKHRGNLIPVFEDPRNPPPSRVGSIGSAGSLVGGATSSSSFAGGAASSSGGVIAAALSPASSAVTSSSVRQERYDTYERIMQGGAKGAAEENEKDGTWAAIPEQPRDDSKSESGGNLGHNVSFQADESQPNQQSQKMDPQSQNAQMNNAQSAGSLLDLPSPNDNPSAAQSINATSQHMHRRLNYNRQNAIHPDPTQSLSPQTISSQSYNPNASPNSTKENYSIILQPDAIYEEHYGDAYVDELVKYLYPEGYQSMRPRSGPWKLSIIIFILFMWLSVFIVGHCYDRGQQEYNSYFNNADDAYLQEVDDDMLLMETRWCGSKPLYFMWLVSVWITVLSMSYCSIIGYVKVRDIAVANGRSQPPGMGITSSGRSDYYVMVENVSSMNDRGMATVAKSSGNDADGNADGAAAKDSQSSTGYYSSYQDGVSGRAHVPSIYQSDGTPQFWGGHIYRPTQAAVAMTNRP